MLASAASTVLRVHQNWAWVVIFGNGLVGLWGLAVHFFRPAWGGRPFWIGVVTATTCIGVQVALGATMYALGLRANNFHVFYGVLLVIAPTLMYVYKSEPAVKRRVYLWYGLAHLFFMGLAIRALLKAGLA